MISKSWLFLSLSSIFSFNPLEPQCQYRARRPFSQRKGREETAEGAGEEAETAERKGGEGTKGEAKGSRCT